MNVRADDDAERVFSKQRFREFGLSFGEAQARYGAFHKVPLQYLIKDIGLTRSAGVG